ncbi:MAG: AIR synthase family protein [Candidatus Margulisbacteria bacterium]|nr:AIR synthase family protein [Candidatus Margulisiibacteriota bacterium]
MDKEKLPELGKIHPEFFDRVIYPRLGAKDKNLIIGPRHGVDYGVIKVGQQCLAMSTDPFFIVPQLGFARAAWFGFHIVMCDVAVSGLVPKYLTIDLNLPPEITEEQLAEMWEAVHTEAKKYKITIATGHTARYAGCNYPMVGGATSIAVGSEKELRGPHKVRVGDQVIITKGPAIETTGLLAALFPDKFKAAGGAEFQKAAADIYYQMSVLDDCAIARRFPGVHAMHDATECGIWGGLYEMARAGDYGLWIEQELIPVQPVIKKTAEVFDFDPFCAISEGTLIAIVNKKDADKLNKEFKRKGILSAVVGEVVPKAKGLKIVNAGQERKLEHPKVDPYWQLVEKLAQFGT